MIKYCVLGLGGHAKMLAALLGPLVELIDRDAEPQDGQVVFIGVGNAPRVGDSDLRRRAVLFGKHHQRVLGYADPSALIAGLHDYTAQIMPRAVLQPYSMVGTNCIINTGAIIEHDCVVGAHSHIAPGAILCGGIKVGELTHVGAGAVVLPGVVIGSSCVIGAGAVVTHDVVDGATVVGNPGRVV